MSTHGGQPGPVHMTLENIQLHFGGVMALARVRLKVLQGEILAIIGPNGAGKTSLLNCISGLYRPQRGRILFQNHDITRLRLNQIANLGIARSFQNIELFRGMTVLDNLMLGRHVHLKSGLLSGGLSC